MLKVFLVFIFFLYTGLSQPLAEHYSDEEVELQHQRGVNLARSGDHHGGLVVLNDLLSHKPGHYPVIRDIVIITSWTGNCALTLELYKKIQSTPRQEPYLTVPISDCLYETGEKIIALEKLETAMQLWPENPDLRQTYKTLSDRLENEFTPAAAVSFSAGMNESDQGNREWLFTTRLERYLDDTTTLYLRYQTIRADDPQFDTGDLNRVALGARFNMHPEWYLQQEFSDDTRESNESGATVILGYQPTPLWHFDITHATFAEDLPLRAKALKIESNKTALSADFHTRDYLWTWYGGINRYSFSDGNDRKSLNTSLSYAYVLKPELEQRLIVGVYASRNSNINAVYYNPREDKSITLTHQLDIVYDSKFKRHVDHFYVHLGNYIQQGEDTKGTWGLRFVQDYDFDKYNSFSVEVAYKESVYDGENESEKSLLIAYSRKI